MTEEQNSKPKAARKPKEPTSKWLRDQALRYLNRFPATTMKMRQHLFDKAKPNAELFGVADRALMASIDAEIAKLVEIGFINDQEFAASKARIMARQGKSFAQIGLKLQTLGFTDDQRDRALEELGDDKQALDQRAAARYVQRRRFGPYKPEATREARRNKELASLARNGFSYDIAVAVVDAETTEEIEEMISGKAS